MEPIFVKQTMAPRQVKNMAGWFAEIAKDAKEAGCTYTRMSANAKGEARTALLCEGWAEKPDDAGPRRWKGKAVL